VLGIQPVLRIESAPRLRLRAGQQGTHHRRVQEDRSFFHLGVTLSFLYTYKGWHIDCEPQAASNGTFAAHAVFSAGTEGGHVKGTLTPARPPFATSRDAADAALAAVRKWIDEH
jgi:hypothetical protein